MTKDTEAQLAERLQQGDKSVLGLIYDTYAGFLTGVAARYVSDADMLHDVLQESFIKVFTHPDKFQYRGPGSFRAWMSRIVVNESLRQLRDAASRHAVPVDALSDDLPDEEPDIGGLTGDVITALLQKLPPGYREVFNLYVVEGWSHKQIARELGIKPDSSASQFHRARNMLAHMIKEYKRKQEKI